MSIDLEKLERLRADYVPHSAGSTEAFVALTAAYLDAMPKLIARLRRAEKDNEQLCQALAKIEMGLGPMLLANAPPSEAHIQGMLRTIVVALAARNAARKT